MHCIFRKLLLSFSKPICIYSTNAFLRNTSGPQGLCEMCERLILRLCRNVNITFTQNIYSEGLVTMTRLLGYGVRGAFWTKKEWGQIVQLAAGFDWFTVALVVQLRCDYA